MNSELICYVHICVREVHDHIREIWYWHKSTNFLEFPRISAWVLTLDLNIWFTKSLFIYALGTRLLKANTLILKVGMDPGVGLKCLIWPYFTLPFNVFRFKFVVPGASTVNVHCIHSLLFSYTFLPNYPMLCRCSHWAIFAIHEKWNWS